MVIRPVHEPCMKSVRIRIYSGPYFPAFELNTDRYSVSLRIQLKCGKIPTRITPNTDIFYAVEKFVVNDKDTRIDQVSLVLNKVRRPSVCLLLTGRSTCAVEEIFSVFSLLYCTHHVQMFLRHR